MKRTDLALLALLAAATYALKRHYAGASAAELEWILGPTASLVALATGSAWPFEAGVGHVSVAHATAIVPACAGVNFLCVAAATLVVGFLTRFERPGHKLGFFAAALLVAYPAVLLTNALRILADLGLRQVPALAAAHGDAHRVMGVLLYLGAACLLYAAGDRLTRRAAP